MKNEFSRTPRNITSLHGSCYKPINSSVSQDIFSYVKMFNMQCRKNITAKDNKKKINVANFINLCTNMYIHMLYLMRMTQYINDSINSILQHGPVVDKNCCVVFPTSKFPCLILCSRQCKWKVATTYLAIKSKNN